MDTIILHFFNGSDSLWLDQVALTATHTLTWVPLFLVLFYIVVKNNEKMSQIMLVVLAVLVALLLSGGLSDLVIKPLVGRLRPSLDPSVCGTLHLVDGTTGTGFSFFSSHAANYMALAVLMSWVVKSRQLTIGLVLWALLVAWTRLYLGVHWPSDVAVGLIWGAAAGTIAYALYLKLYYKISPRLHFISTQYTSSGYAHSDVDMVLVILVLTLLYCVVSATTAPF